MGKTDAFRRVVEEAASRECRPLYALLDTLEQGKGREEQLFNTLQMNQAQHKESTSQVQALRVFAIEFPL